MAAETSFFLFFLNYILQMHFVLGYYALKVGLLMKFFSKKKLILKEFSSIVSLFGGFVGGQVMLY